MSNRPDVHIRRAHPHEAALLSAIAMSSKAHWPYTAAQLAAWGAQLRVEPETITRGWTWVAEHDGALLGFFALQPHAPYWDLAHFWVLPAHMGRGVGRAMLEQAARIAGEAGTAAITIDADPHAEPFYRACGAVFVGTRSAPIDGDPQRQRPQLLLRLDPGGAVAGQMDTPSV